MKIIRAFALLACLCAGVSAQAAPVSPTQQVDGIVSAAVDALWAQTDVYWHLGDYPRIIALDRVIVQADPKFVEAYSTGGWLLWSMGLNKDAEAFYEQGVKNNPQSSYAYYNLGFFYFNTMHDYPSALRVFQKDSTLANSDINDWKMLAHSYERLHKYDQAVATWQKIKKRWPNGAAVEVNLNRALEQQRAAHAGAASGGSSAR